LRKLKQELPKEFRLAGLLFEHRGAHGVTRPTKSRKVAKSLSDYDGKRHFARPTASFQSILVGHYEAKNYCSQAKFARGVQFMSARETFRSNAAMPNE
jgi:hypothetical protein